jgi:hypothetical protein
MAELLTQQVSLFICRSILLFMSAMTRHLYYVGEKGHTDDRSLHALLKQMFQFQVIKQNSIKSSSVTNFVATPPKQQASVKRTVT